MEIDHTDIVNYGEADSVNSGVWTSSDGSVRIVQPGGDFFRQPADNSADSQVRSRINKIFIPIFIA